MKYRTKVREIDAVQWTGDNVEEVFRFLWPKTEYDPEKVETSDFIKGGAFYCAGGACPPGGFIVHRADGSYGVVPGGAFLEQFEAAK